MTDSMFGCIKWTENFHDKAAKDSPYLEAGFEPDVSRIPGNESGSALKQFTTYSKGIFSSLNTGAARQNSF
ncbi:unnamed protein product [Caretta caretta]